LKGYHEELFYLLASALAEIEHADELNIQDQMARADEAMYREKRGKRESVEPQRH